MSAEGLLLLIEDDATTREVLTLLLEADGWQVRGAESGTAALDILQQAGAHPEVVLCDLHLPGVHGADLAAALRSTVPRAVLVAMSASGSGEGGSGYDAFLQKPFGPAELRASLAGLRPSPAAGDAGGPGREVQDAALAVIATGTFLKLERQMGARARDLYGFALLDAEERLRRMEQSLRDGKAAEFRAEAHAIKGSAGMIGAERLTELASAAEADTGGTSPGKTVQEMHLACDEIRLMLETLFPI